MKWVSVKDRLPPTFYDGMSSDGEMYSVDCIITDGKDVGVGYYEYEYVAEDPNEPLQYSDAVWHQEGNLLSVNNCGWPSVTHWMPLPKPPEDV